MLQELEEQVRGFVLSWEQKQKGREEEGLGDADSEEDEIVFVGREGKLMHDMPPSPTTKRAWHGERVADAEEADTDVAREKLVFEAMADDHGASFVSVSFRHSCSSLHSFIRFPKTLIPSPPKPNTPTPARIMLTPSALQPLARPQPSDLLRSKHLVAHRRRSCTSGSLHWHQAARIQKARSRRAATAALGFGLAGQMTMVDWPPRH